MPQIPRPALVTDLTARLGCGQVDLEFTPPRTDRQGAPLRSPPLLTLQRKIVPDALPMVLEARRSRADDERKETAPSTQRPIQKDPLVDAPGSFEPVETFEVDLAATGPVQMTDQGGAPTGSDVDGVFSPGTGLVYRIETIDHRGRHYLSTPVSLVFDWIPAAPRLAAINPVEQGVLLQWRPVKRTCNGRPLTLAPSYIVQRARRSESGPPGPFEDLARRATEELSQSGGLLIFLDDQAPLGADLLYRLIAEGRLPEHRSRPSDLEAVRFDDRTPPQPPSGLIAVPGARDVSLVWNPSPDRDVAGYLVYRARGASPRPTEFFQLTPTALKATTYTDTTVVSGETYSYYVTALDGAPKPNESAPSPAVQVALP